MISFKALFLYPRSILIRTGKGALNLFLTHLTNNRRVQVLENSNCNTFATLI